MARHLSRLGGVSMICMADTLDLPCFDEGRLDIFIRVVVSR